MIITTPYFLEVSRVFLVGVTFENTKLKVIQYFKWLTRITGLVYVNLYLGLIMRLEMALPNMGNEI